MFDWTMVDNTWLNQCVSEHFLHHSHLETRRHSFISAAFYCKLKVYNYLLYWAFCKHHLSILELLSMHKNYAHSDIYDCKLL